MSNKKKILLTILGTMITGFAVGSFFTPNKIVGGGVSGLSTILYHSLGIEPGVSFFVLNGVLLIIGLRTLGKSFVAKTLFAATMLSAFVQLFSMMPIYTENMMLATVFGAALYGVGIGLCFAAGGSSGGTDIIGRVIQIKFPYIPIGKTLLFVDGVIIAISLVLFKNLELVLYGVLSLFISTYSIDWVIQKLNISKIAFVITDKGEEIANKLVSTSPRGVTLINVKGMYTNTDKKMLFCALKESELEQFQKKVLEIDPSSFTVFAESQGIKGNGFYFFK